MGVPFTNVIIITSQILLVEKWLVEVYEISLNKRKFVNYTVNVWFGEVSSLGGSLVNHHCKVTNHTQCHTQHLVILTSIKKKSLRKVKRRKSKSLTTRKGHSSDISTSQTLVKLK